MSAHRGIRTIFQAHVRWLIGRQRQRGRRGSLRAVARLRHERLDPRAVVFLRPVRIEADLWAPVARTDVPVRRQPRSSRSARTLRDRSRAGLRRDAGFRPRRSRAVGSYGTGPSMPDDRKRCRRTAHRARRRLFRERRGCGGLRRRRSRVQERSMSRAHYRHSRCGSGTRGRLHRDDGRRRRATSRSPAPSRERLRSRYARPPDRRRDAAGRLVHAGAEGPEDLIARAC